MHAQSEIEQLQAKVLSFLSLSRERRESLFHRVKSVKRSLKDDFDDEVLFLF